MPALYASPRFTIITSSIKPLTLSYCVSYSCFFMQAVLLTSFVVSYQ